MPSMNSLLSIIYIIDEDDNYVRETCCRNGVRLKGSLIMLKRHRSYRLIHLYFLCIVFVDKSSE